MSTAQNYNGMIWGAQNFYSVQVSGTQVRGAQVSGTQISGAHVSGAQGKLEREYELLYRGVALKCFGYLKEQCLNFSVRAKVRSKVE